MGSGNGDQSEKCVSLRKGSDSPLREGWRWKSGPYIIHYWPGNGVSGVVPITVRQSQVNWGS